MKNDFKDTLKYFGTIPLGIKIPVNRKTGREYGPGTRHFWRWWWGQKDMTPEMHRYFTHDEHGYPCYVWHE